MNSYSKIYQLSIVILLCSASPTACSTTRRTSLVESRTDAQHNGFYAAINGNNKEHITGERKATLDAGLPSQFEDDPSFEDGIHRITKRQASERALPELRCNTTCTCATVNKSFYEEEFQIFCNQADKTVREFPS